MVSPSEHAELFPTEREKPPVPERARGPFARVAINRPVRCEFTYRVPAEFAKDLVPGMRVAVPFGAKREIGVVVGMDDATDVPTKRLKSIAASLDTEPVIDKELLDLTHWMAAYYACSWGEALAAILPASLKRERKQRTVLVLSAAEGIGDAELGELEEKQPKQFRLLRTLIEIGAPIEQADILRKLQLSDSPVRTLTRKGWIISERKAQSTDELETSQGDRVRPENLLPAQVAAIDAMQAAVATGEYATFLLRGVTGSGKTEVYLRVIEDALNQGRGAIVLVPEIALTPQTVGWFRSRFENVAVLHSRMTDSARHAMWMRVKRGEARVVVGARSAVFAPVQNLGVIVVDEEHEPSFKQGNSPRYHGRDVAVMRAQRSKAVCILGSATPSLESWRNAQEGRYRLVELMKRVHGGRMPAIEIVDMRQEKPDQRGPLLFSRRLRTLLSEALKRGEQSILFINRRGFAPVLWCRECNETVRCHQCDVALTFHRRIGRAVCHSCCEETAPPKVCPTCTAPALAYIGLGSERVEASLAKLLPEARVGRMDSDTMLRREDYESTLSAFGKGELDVLVGTQMIAKGLDFPRVTVVGIVSADSTLHLPDFRASERTFQLISQVAGRAGRGELEGRIAIQTLSPEHPAIVKAARHDYEGFAALEAGLRAELGYPPSGRLVRVVFEDEDEERVTRASTHFADVLRRELEGSGVTLLGPAPAPMALQRGRHRQHLIVKSAGEAGLGHARSLLTQLAAEHARPRVAIDVDPVGML